jgi:hypothetical protein
MKSLCYVYVCLVSVLILAGCATPDKTMRSYLNHHYSDLVANWGQPDQTMSDGNGGQIWTYLKERSWTMPGSSQTTEQITSYNNFGATSAYGQANTTYTPPQTTTWQSRRTFFINADGIIYRYSWQGR